MLVLTRRVGESIIIDGGIEIVVTQLRDNHVGLGIKAPKEVNIVRKELLEEVKDG